MSDSTTIVLVVLLMLVSPLLSLAVVVVMDRRQRANALSLRVAQLVRAIESGVQFLMFSGAPCGECGAEWRCNGDPCTGDVMEHGPMCAFALAEAVVQFRFDAAMAEWNEGAFAEDGAF